ncbi:MAG: hypothetical protein Q3988_01040 [Gemella sp.]|nr:hypothetical protein [Gemella sp.]
MNLKERIALTILFLSSYLLLPTIVLNYNDDLSKAAFIILLLVAFMSFAINMLITYFKGKHIEVPILSVLLSLPLFYIFNKSAVVPVVIIAVLSFLAYFLGGIFTIKGENDDTNSNGTN